MEDRRYYFLLCWCAGMLFAGFIIGCTAPLEAGGSDCGSTEWKPCYVKIVD